MRYLLICVTALTMLGCASIVPYEVDFQPAIVVTIPGELDAVWAAIVEYFAVCNVPIAIIEKDSGMIVSEWMDAGAKRSRGEDKTLCSCARAGVLTRLCWTRLRISVFVKRADDGGVALRVWCWYEQGRQVGASSWVVYCNSTGNLERQLREYVRAKLQGSPAPEVRALQRATSD